MRRPNWNDFSTLDNESLRQVNESLVLNLIRERQPISRADLARSTSLKDSTISSIVKSLADRNLVYESMLGDSTGGRKPRMLRVNGNHSMAIGVDLGVRDTTIGLSNFNGEIVHKRVIKTNKAHKPFLQELAREVESMIKTQIPRGIKLEGVGVSLPGLTDSANGKIIYSANLGWRNVDVGNALRQRIDYPLVFEDSSFAAGLAELWFSDLADLTGCHIVTLSVSEGLGTAIIIAGHLYRGATQGAGQFGHVSLDPQGPLCNCGNRGCWELYASDLATINRYLGYQKRHSKRVSAQPTVSQIVRRAVEGDPIAKQAVVETGRYLGRGIAVLVNGLNPEVIIVDGQISQAWKIIEPEIRCVLESSALSPSLVSLRLKPSMTGDNPFLMGVISLVLYQRFAIPKVA